MNKLTTGLKVLYGIGFSSRGIKDGLFQIFLFFYFSQVLGLIGGVVLLAFYLSALIFILKYPIDKARLQK